MAMNGFKGFNKGNAGKIGLFVAGLLAGTAGIKILSSKDAKKVYTNCTAAALRAKDSIMKTATTIQENAGDILAEAKYRLMLGEDMFGRDARFERVEVDDTYPEYLLQHRKDYEYLIMPPISKAKRNYIRISMKVKNYSKTKRSVSVPRNIPMPEKPSTWKVCRRIRRIFSR